MAIKKYTPSNEKRRIMHNKVVDIASYVEKLALEGIINRRKKNTILTAVNKIYDILSAANAL